MYDIKTNLKKNMKVSFLQEEMRKSFEHISNALMDCYALSTHMALSLSHFQNSQTQGVLLDMFREVVI